MWKLLAFVLPLGLDSFAVAAALGARRPGRAQRWRLSALFVLCEAGMPMVGLAGIWTALVLGLSISLDELAIGCTVGLAGLPFAGVTIAIAVQAVVATQLGLALGARLREGWREHAQRLAGVLLILLGIGLVATRVLG